MLLLGFELMYKRKFDTTWADGRPKFQRTSAFIPSIGVNRFATRNGRSQNVSRSFTSRRSTGPYRALTSGSRHTNSAYPKPELKFFDVDEVGLTPPANTPQAITNVGSTSVLNTMTTGTGVQNFVGNQVAVKSVSYRVELDLPAAPANQLPTSGRVVLVWDKQPNGAVAAWATIFQSANYLAYINTNFRDRFVILRNDQFSLSPNGDQTLFFERNVKINMLTTFVSGQAVQGVPNTGALLICYIADQAGAVNQPTINGWFRVRYFDN